MAATLDIGVHPAANIFPMEDEAALRELAQDIRANGLLLDCVKMPDGLLLDGRNRYVACKMAGVAARFTTYVGDDPVGFVWSMNGPRRHLSASQKAMAAAAMANLRNGSNQYAAKEGVSRDTPSKNSDGDAENADFQAKSQKRAAAEVGVSRESVNRAAKVRREAQPEVVKAVEAGKLTVKRAVKLAKEKPETQRKVAAAPDPEKAAAEALTEEGCSDGLDIDPLHNAGRFDDALAALTLATRHINSITGPERAPKPIPGGELLAAHGQEVRSHIRNAAEGIKGNRPHRTCPYCFGKSGGSCPACKGTRWVARTTFEEAPADLRAKVEGKNK